MYEPENFKIVYVFFLWIRTWYINLWLKRFLKNVSNDNNKYCFTIKMFFKNLLFKNFKNILDAFWHKIVCIIFMKKILKNFQKGLKWLIFNRAFLVFKLYSIATLEKYLYHKIVVFNSIQFYYFIIKQRLSIKNKIERYLKCVNFLYLINNTFSFKINNTFTRISTNSHCRYTIFTCTIDVSYRCILFN